MYAKLLDNEVYIYPYSIKELKLDNPNTSFPDNLSSEDLLYFDTVVVERTEQPFATLTTSVTEGLPVNDNGVWKQTWTVSMVSPEEIQARTEKQSVFVREQRNNLLSQTDWTQVADAPVDKQAWASYRQELRDITSQTSFPFAILWPVAPN